MVPQKISIIIPVKPGGEVRALGRLRLLDYPAGSFEVLVAEGSCPSRQRNIAAGRAGGEILCFLDDDSMVEPAALSTIADHFSDEALAVVGGPSLTPESDSVLQRSFGMALASPFGGGGVSNRYRRRGVLRETGDHELILCNLAVSARVFRENDGFDERLYPNEENELLVRIKRQGGKLMHDPELAVFRSQRRSIPAFIRQLFGYGRGRAQQILLGGGSGPAPYVPAVFLVYLFVLPFVQGIVYYFPLLCYLVMCAAGAVHAVVEKKDPLPALLLPLVFALLHLSYGAGLIWGLIRYAGRSRVPSQGVVTVKRIKEFGSGAEW
ncbi:MAG: glycosyl transferase family 2 [Geobacteraceae bacterium]|nr:glycosyl transferase family 2 [Geobacteraceae bacterium]